MGNLLSKVKLPKEIFNSSLYVIANLAAPLATFALIPILTRHLTLEEIGGIFIFQAILLVAVNIVAVGSMSLLQGLYFRVRDQFSVYLVSSMVTSSVVWSIICFLGYWKAEKLFLGLGLPTMIGLIAIFASLGAVLQAVYLSLLQIREQPKQYLIVLVSVHLIGFLVSVALIFLVSPSLMSRVIGIVVGTLCGASVALYYLGREMDSAPRFEVMRELFIRGIPIIFHSSAMLLIAQTDKFLIGNLLSLSEVGTYGVSAQLASVVQILAGGMAMAYAPSLYKRLAAPHQDDGGKSAKTFRLFSIILYLFLVCYVVFVHYFNPILFGPTFVFQEVSFLILAVGSALFGTYYFFSGYFYYYQYTKLLALITCIIGVVNLIVSYYLIPRYGINGAAVGSFFAYMVALLCAGCAGVYFRKKG